MAAVLDMWWEGNDFHVITDDGQHSVYKDAHVTDIKRDFGDAPNVTVEDTVTYVYRETPTLTVPDT